MNVAVAKQGRCVRLAAFSSAANGAFARASRMQMALPRASGTRKSDKAMLSLRSNHELSVE